MKTRYYKYKIENLLHVTKIVTVHHFELEQGFVRPSEEHDFWEMVYVEQGGLVCTVNREKTTLLEGEVIFHKPSELHAHTPLGNENAKVFIISFECKSEAIEILGGRRLSLDEDLIRYVYMIMEEAGRTFDLGRSTPDIRRMPLCDRTALGGLQFIRNLLELFIIGAIRQVDGEEDGSSFILKEHFGEYLVNEIIEYLTANVGGRVSVDDVARSMNYTRSYIFRRFKEVTGQSVMSYYTSLKVKEAKRLLRHTDLTVSEISERLSFDTPNYFSKTFKRISGITPLTYRKTRRK